MNKFPFENSNSKSSQSNFSENMISLSPKSQERFPESQKPLSINETPLSSKGNIKSYCRIRPNNTYNSSLNKFKIENNSKTLIVDYTAESDRNNPSKQFVYKYNFTEIYWSHTTNQEIYEKVCKQNIEELFSHHRSSLIFVYGITNSGKTYTVNGNEQFPGILQLSLIELFNKFHNLKENNDLWQLTCTYIEIYNEEVYDLLSNDRKRIRVGGTTNRFYPVGNIVKSIESISDFTNCLKVGEANKTIAETNANANSSRSHSFFRVELSYKDSQFIEPISFCIVDLAGAERVSRSGVLGNGVTETGNINSSLLVLKKCFSIMEANSRINNIENKLIVPVRESKLTMLFKEYFAPHQNISVICTINPDKNDMMDIRSVLNFGAKAMKVKPMKSWIPINNYSSREVSPNKSRGKGNNSSIKDKKRYRMYTEKKYLNYNPKNNFSKEKISKNREDYYSNDHSNNKKKNNFISIDKPQNIKIIKNKKFEYNHNIINNIRHIDLNNENSNNNCQIYSSNNDENSNNNSQIHLSRNGEQSNNNSSLNIIKISNSNYEQRIKCSTNPFELVIDKSNFFVQNGPSKEKLKLEQEMKEKKQKEMSKKGDEIKKMLLDLLIKKKYYNNFERNIEIYETQCNNIDLTEAEILLSKNSNIFSLKNPFIKNYKEDKHILSKSHQINLTYENVIKEKILKNENNINISYKGTRANNNLENFKNYNQDIPNNDFDIIRANKEFMEELQIKLNNSNNEIEQKMIQEFLDRSFQQYEKSQFKAHFGIGESLIKKIPEQQNKKEDNKFVQKFDIMNNDIEMADNLNNKSNDYNIDDLFENTFNYKSKKGNNKIKEEISKNDKEMDDNKENKDENAINKSNENGSEEISDIENKKKKRKKKKNDKNDEKEKSKKPKKSKKNKKSKKHKEIEEEKGEDKEEKKEEKEEEREEKIDEEKNGEEKTNEDKDEEVEDQSENRTKKYPKSKSKKRNENRYKKKSHDSNSNDDDTSEEKNESAILAVKNNKKKKKKNKKRKIESDEDDIDGDNSFNEGNANIKPIKSKKNKSKKLK